MKIDRDQFKAATLALGAVLATGCDLPAQFAAKVSPEKPGATQPAAAQPAAADEEPGGFDRTGEDHGSERGQISASPRKAGNSRQFAAPTREGGGKFTAPTKEGGYKVPAPTKELGGRPPPAPAKEAGFKKVPAPSKER